MKRVVYMLMALIFFGFGNQGYCTNNDLKEESTFSSNKIRESKDNLSESEAVPYVSKKLKYIGIDKKRDVALFQEKSEEPFFKRLQNVFPFFFKGKK